MKVLKRGLLVAVVLLALSFCLVGTTACGGVTLPAGTYEGSYTCTYKVGETEKWGINVSFDVDDSNYIWNLTTTVPEGYSCPIGQRPWDAGKFTQQFSGIFTVEDVANMRVKLNEAGYPDGTDCVDTSSVANTTELLLLTGYEQNCAIAILAMQNAINNAK